jgi:hypothetical protein
VLYQAGSARRNISQMIVKWHQVHRTAQPPLMYPSASRAVRFKSTQPRLSKCAAFSARPDCLFNQFARASQFSVVLCPHITQIILRLGRIWSKLGIFQSALRLNVIAHSFVSCTELEIKLIIRSSDQ